MEILEHSTNRLVCREVAWRVGAVLTAIALGLGFKAWVLEPDPRWEPGLAVAFLLAMAWGVTYRTTAVIDRQAGVARREVWRVGRLRRSELALDDVESVVVYGGAHRSGYGPALRTHDGRYFPLLLAYTLPRRRKHELAAQVRQLLEL